MSMCCRNGPSSMIVGLPHLLVQQGTNGCIRPIIIEAGPFLQRIALQNDIIGLLLLLTVDDLLLSKNYCTKFSFAALNHVH